MHRPYSVHRCILYVCILELYRLLYNSKAFCMLYWDFFWKNEAIAYWLISVSGQGNVHIDKSQNGKKKVNRLDVLIGHIGQIGKTGLFEQVGHSG